MKINRHGITLSLISFLIAGAPAFAQDDSSWASPGTASASETSSTAVGAWARAGKAGTALGSCIVCACAVFHIRGDVSLRKSEGV